jgi:excinuclease ABC subunit B
MPIWSPISLAFNSSALPLVTSFSGFLQVSLLISDKRPKTVIETPLCRTFVRLRIESPKTLSNPFRVDAPFKPAGDQPQAIAELVEGVGSGLTQQVLAGVTGSGKTNVMAWAVEQLQRPVLVLSPNKTLAAQLCAEFRRLLPDNAVEYFVSYYDYYQPEAYIARTDTYIEKDSSRNDDIDRMRHSATQSLLTRRDVLVVASVSCIYGIGSVEDYMGESLHVEKGQSIRREVFLRKLTEMLYERNDYDLARLRFRVRGDVVDLVPANEEKVYRVEFFGDEVERIQELDATTGEILGARGEFTVFPASHYVTPADKLRLAMADIEAELEERCKWFEDHGRLLEAQRLRQRTNFDLEMLRETGTCAGIENYSRHLTRRQPGEAPYTLMDFLPADTLIFVDESHVAVPQIGGMLGGDRSRKAALVEYGFRLPSAFDNRPLSFEEWEERAQNVVYVSATPGPYEMRRTQRTVEMIVRPTGLVDPTVEVRPTEGQIDDLLAEVRKRADMGQRSLVTTLTKRFAEDLADYLREYGVKVRYLHSELDAMQRIEVLTALRTGEVDVVVGINLLREGLDLPEVAFIGILDADKEGYLRAYRSFIQIIGRAARNVEGHVVMYADSVTDSMRQALDETERRRAKQIAYNAEHGITPETVKKAIYALEINENDIQADAVEIMAGAGVPREDLLAIVRDLEKEMRRLSKELQFEDAARVRDRIILLRRRLSGELEVKEDDADVAMAVAAAPKQKTQIRNWRRTRRGP